MRPFRVSTVQSPEGQLGRTISPTKSDLSTQVHLPDLSLVET